MIVCKVVNILTSKETLPILNKISGLLGVISIMILFSLPYLSVNNGITEKNLKNSDNVENLIKFPTFHKHSEEFFEKYTQLLKDNRLNDIDFSIKSLFSDMNLQKEVFEFKQELLYFININSYKQTTSNAIVLTFVYDANVPFFLSKNLFIIYNFLSQFQKKDSLTWLTKDLGVLFLPRSLDNQPEELADFISSNLYVNKKIEYTLNFDLKYDLVDAQNLLIGYSGKNSEKIDSDLYKIMLDNVSKEFGDKLTTHEFQFESETRDFLKSIFGFIDDFFASNLNQLLMNNKNSVYSFDMIYTLEDIVENNFFAKNINLNHVLISKGIQSISFKTTSEIEQPNELQDNDFLKKQKNKLYLNFKFLQEIEAIIRALNVIQIQIFRGEYHYLMSSPLSLIPSIFFLSPLFGAIYTLYLMFNSFLRIDFSVVKSFKILAFQFIFAVFYFIVLVHLPEITKVFSLDILVNFYILLFVFLIANIIIFKYLIRLTSKDLMFLDCLRTFITICSCFNIFCINYGIGLFACLIMLFLEFFNYKMNLLLKRRFSIFNIVKFIPDFLFFSLILNSQHYFSIMLKNYTLSFNNAYLSIIGLILLIILNFTLNLIQATLSYKSKTSTKVKN